MVKEQKDAKYKCEECGVVIAVDEPCGCDPSDLVCAVFLWSKWHLSLV